MTGIPRLDAAAFAIFAALAITLVAQLVRAPPRAAGATSIALHLVMALGMAAMCLPRHDPLAPEVWMATFTATAAGAVVLCVRRRRRGDRNGGKATTRPDDHVVASLLMVVGFAGHGAHATPGASGDTHVMIDRPQVPPPLCPTPPWSATTQRPARWSRPWGRRGHLADLAPGRSRFNRICHPPRGHHPPRSILQVRRHLSMCGQDT